MNYDIAIKTFFSLKMGSCPITPAGAQSQLSVALDPWAQLILRPQPPE